MNDEKNEMMLKTTFRHTASREKVQGKDRVQDSIWNSFLAINRQIIAQGGQAIIIYCQISLYIIGRQLAIVSPNKVPT